jgi:hypothetical protein
MREKTVLFIDEMTMNAHDITSKDVYNYMRVFSVAPKWTIISNANLPSDDRIQFLIKYHQTKFPTAQLFTTSSNVIFSCSSVETFSKDLRDTEKVIKKEFEVGSMPGPWRSAKSVIQGAMKLSIGLVDDNGGYCGKTYLQNKIKEMKTGVKEPMTNEEYSNKIIKMLMNPPEELDSGLIFKTVRDFVTGN